MEEKYREQLLREETSRCLLCQDAPCTASCPEGLPLDKMIRSIRFENKEGAASRITAKMYKQCLDCTEATCMQACLRSKVDRPIAIQELVSELVDHPKSSNKPVDLGEIGRAHV